MQNRAESAEYVCVTADSIIESYVDLKASRLPQQTDTQCPVTTDAVGQQPILNTSICTAEPVSAADDLQLLCMYVMYVCM